MSLGDLTTVCVVGNGNAPDGDSYVEDGIMYESPVSVYTVLARYVSGAKKNGNFVSGYIDGMKPFENFLNEFAEVCNTRFTTRTSWKKSESDNPHAKGRYGRHDRIYWKYKSGNVVLPFTGAPFIVQSCTTKHCHLGRHYYKSTEDRYREKLEQSEVDPSIPTPPEMKRRRVKPTKKKDCPAKIHIREICLFEEFSLPENCNSNNLKVSKAEKLVLLRKRLNEDQDKVFAKSTKRFYLNLPLPEVHSNHEIRGFPRYSIPADIIKVIDECIDKEICDVQKVQQEIEQRGLSNRQITLNQCDEGSYYEEFIIPSDDDVAEYIYIRSITPKQIIILHQDSDGGADIPIDSLVEAINPSTATADTVANAYTLHLSSNQLEAHLLSTSEQIYLNQDFQAQGDHVDFDIPITAENSTSAAQSLDINEHYVVIDKEPSLHNDECADDEHRIIYREHIDYLPQC